MAKLSTILGAKPSSKLGLVKKPDGSLCTSANTQEIKNHTSRETFTNVTKKEKQGNTGKGLENAY
jgi:hypothetical protein